MSNLNIVVGDSGILLDKKIEEILNDINKEYDLVDIDLEEDSIISLLNELKTLPFLSDARVVRLKNPKFLYNSSAIDPRLIEEFIEFCNNPIDTTILITIIDNELYSKIKKEAKELSKKAFNALTDKSSIYTIGNYTASDIDAIIKEEAEDYKIDSRAIEELKLRTEGDPTRVIAEISKLKLYKCEDKTINLNDVDLLVSRDLEDKVYLLTQSIISKSRKTALNLYSDFKKSGIIDSLILAQIISKFQELYMVKLMSQSSYTKDMIAEEFHVKSGRAYYMMQDAAKIKLDLLKDKYEEVVNIDYNIKRGYLDKDNALWLYLLNI